MTCEVCNGPLHRDSKYGVCWRNPGCRRAYRSRWRAENPESNKEHHKRWADANLARRSLARAKVRAAQKGIPFSLSFNDLPPVPELCPVLGVRLEPGTNGKASPHSLALDRIEPSEGYIPGNVQWLSHRANIMKNDASPEELLAFAAWVNETYGSTQQREQG